VDGIFILKNENDPKENQMQKQTLNQEQRDD
jgi:hypothetical protein